LEQTEPSPVSTLTKTAPPPPESFEAFCADSRRVDAVMNDVYARGDRLMSVLVGVHFAFSVAFSAFYGTWLASLAIGVSAGAMFYLSVALLPRHRITRIVAGISLQTFVMLHIWQLHGLPEMHFFFFTACTAMVVYEDALSIWPGTALILTQHVAFAVLQNSGAQVYFFPDAYVSFAKLFFHSGIVVMQVMICGFWAIFLRRQALLAAFQRDAIVTKSEALAGALRDLEESQERRTRTEKLAAIGQLAASVAHELRNPLAAVSNAATYLTRRLTDPKLATVPIAGDAKVRQFLALMREQLDASAKIISDLLDFARERKPHLRPCPLRPLVDDVFELVPAPGGVTLHNDVPDGLPVPIVDKDQFRQVFVNLVQNALEAMGERENGEVRVGAEVGDDRTMRIVVRDNGHGMPDDVLKKIFQPLYTTKIKGTGLGLAVVASTVASHNASISAESEVGKGTSFTIRLSSEAIEPEAHGVTAVAS
jgi:signal transduction histidine kinase